MTTFTWIAVGLALGLGLGAAFVALRRPSSGPPTRLEARLEVQAAELRRLADASTAREGSAQQLR